MWPNGTIHPRSTRTPIRSTRQRGERAQARAKSVVGSVDEQRLAKNRTLGGGAVLSLATSLGRRPEAAQEAHLFHTFHRSRKGPRSIVSPTPISLTFPLDRTYGRNLSINLLAVPSVPSPVPRLIKPFVGSVDFLPLRYVLPILHSPAVPLLLCGSLALLRVCGDGWAWCSLRLPLLQLRLLGALMMTTTATSDWDCLTACCSLPITCRPANDIRPAENHSPFKAPPRKLH